MNKKGLVKATNHTCSRGQCKTVHETNWREFRLFEKVFLGELLRLLLFIPLFVVIIIIIIIISIIIIIMVGGGVQG